MILECICIALNNFVEHEAVHLLRLPSHLWHFRVTVKPHDTNMCNPLMVFVFMLKLFHNYFIETLQESVGTTLVSSVVQLLLMIPWLPKG